MRSGVLYGNAAMIGLYRKNGRRNRSKANVVVTGGLGKNIAAVKDSLTTTQNCL